MKEIEFDVL